MKQLLAIIISLLACAMLQAQVVYKKGRYYENNKPYTGEYRLYTLNGDKVAHFSVVKGKPSGILVIYHKDGTTETGHYRNGKIDGAWQKWDNKGQKLAEGYYVSGKKNGKWIIWNDKGEVRYELDYRFGNRVQSLCLN